MNNLDISKMTSDEAFALLDEETSDQEGVTDQQAMDSDIGGDSDAEDDLPYESLASTRSSSRLCPSSSSSQYTPTQNVHSAPVPSTSSSRPKTLRKIITPRRIRHHQSSTVDLEEPEPYSSMIVWKTQITLLINKIKTRNRHIALLLFSQASLQK
ncbi:hypothetical protein JTB14_030124 [Gonioctena quinquepunctata]|nr:hypothetical protein JTB14_030124 [Gonioctena quinquepunctata]